jgi:hypothetical protein
MPKRLAIGTVARCKVGRVGLITGEARRRCNLAGGCTYFYTGVCLDPRRVGFAWQSINPEPIGNLDEWVKLRAEEI